ncbi:MAG: sulfatase-like hydrolase/transferase [Bacteroidota bacterium]
MLRFVLPLLLVPFLCTCDRGSTEPVERAQNSQAVKESNRQAVNEQSEGLSVVNPRPNILFILTDDQGIGDLSLHGNDSIQTPNMDALLTSAARVSHFYVSPVCAPTRASFLSGMYAPRTGAVFVTRRRETMDDAVKTIPEYLRELGYRTGLFGKWHNGATAPYDPAGQGFDEFLGFTLGHFNDYFNGELQNENNELVPFNYDLTDLLTDTAAAFMLESDQPFFTMLTYQAPHTPIQVADDHWNAVKSRGLSDYNTGIYAMVESIDEQIGRLLGIMEKAGKLDNTVVIFSTDNGPNGDRFRKGLKGTKGHVDEGGVRVPFGVRFPGNHPANGRQFPAYAGHIDLLPTLLDYLGEEVPMGIDGLSLMPLLDDDRFTYYDYNRPLYGFKQNYNFSPYPGRLRNRNFLYILRDEDQHELYRIDKDEVQSTNIMETTEAFLEQHRQIGREMAERYAKFAAKVARPELVAPPVNVDAARGPLRLLAHEGEPRGTTRFQDQYGWANDFFVDLGTDGAYWPIETEVAATYSVMIRYHLAANQAHSTGSVEPRTLVLSTDKGNAVKASLAPAITAQIPVADRTPRKEVYPRQWAEARVSGLRLEPGATELSISAPAAKGLWVKEITLERE